MAAARKKRKNSKQPQSLSGGRPKGIVKPQPTQSSKVTRNIIRSHHQLNKAYAQAISSGDDAEAARLKSLLDANGGLEAYQSASITGQSASRGGDSSEVLIEWLRSATDGPFETKMPKMTALEVGALSTKNALSRCGLFSVERIDLNSQDKAIMRQDFMERPLPIEAGDPDRFDLISLSLVLNYVPDAVGRGQMLKRICTFLKEPRGLGLFPSLFFVLPAPCVTNSRYLNEDRLGELMTSLGFEMKFRKLSSKLVYYLWTWQGRTSQTKKHFAKTQVNPGANRNNFCVVLE